MVNLLQPINVAIAGEGISTNIELWQSSMFPNWQNPQGLDVQRCDLVRIEIHPGQIGFVHKGIWINGGYQVVVQEQQFDRVWYGTGSNALKLIKAHIESL